MIADIAGCGGAKAIGRDLQERVENRVRHYSTEAMWAARIGGNTRQTYSLDYCIAFVCDLSTPIASLSIPGHHNVIMLHMQRRQQCRSFLTITVLSFSVSHLPIRLFFAPCDELLPIRLASCMHSALPIIQERPSSEVFM